MLLPDLHTDFSRGMSGGVVSPSLSEFSTVYCDPHSQTLWHSQNAGSSKKQESSRKTSLSALLTMPKPLTVWITKKLWKILKEMGIPDHLTCLLRSLYKGEEATVRTGHGTTDWFQLGKGVRQGCILSPCLFSLHAEYIMRNAGLEEAQAGIKIAGRISITSDMQMTPTLWQKVKKN